MNIIVIIFIFIIYYGMLILFLIDTSGSKNQKKKNYPKYEMIIISNNISLPNDAVVYTYMVSNNVASRFVSSDL